jgi:CTP:molybdopterin cytidylyltransferase MocA
MGRPKLLLPVGSRTVIRALLDSLEGMADRIFILVRDDDEPLRRELSQSSAVVVSVPNDPPEMRDSVEHLLEEVRNVASPMEGDGWLLVPADHPVVNRETLMILLREREEQPEAIHVPKHHGRRGHPTLFPWPLAAEVFALPPGHGVNELLKRPAIAVCEHAVDDPAVLWDLDTPEDYDRLVKTVGRMSSPDSR